MNLYLLIIYFFVFYFGAIVGSFINVVALRYNTGQSFLTGRSRCLSCGRILKWYENLPVFSFILQKRRCRGCGVKISWQYFIVESIAGLVFFGIFYFLFARNQFNISGVFAVSLFYYWTVFGLLMAIAVYDFRHQIVPDSMVYLFGVLSFVSLAASFGPGPRAVERVNFDIGGFMAGISLFSFFALIWFLSGGRAIGFGDAKLALGIGWLLGAAKGILAAYLSFLIPALPVIFIALPLKKLLGDKNFYPIKRLGIKSRIPLGPFLALAAFISFIWGDFFISFLSTYLPI